MGERGDRGEGRGETERDKESEKESERKQLKQYGFCRTVTGYSIVSLRMLYYIRTF